MKNIILVIALIFTISSNIQAFDSGVYKCNSFPLNTIFTLKNNGRAKMSNGIETKRGNWKDDDDAAIIITTNTIIEDNGNGKYTYNNMFSCKKVK